VNILRIHIVIICLIAAAGCAMDGEQQTVETELRDKESTIRHLEKRVTESEQLLADQDREIETLRSAADTTRATTVAKVGGKSSTGFSNVSATTEAETAWGSVHSVRIHKLTTGVVKDPGGETHSLNVVLQPLDEDNELVKVAATLTLTASTISADGTPNPLVTKTFDLTESRRLWSRGLVSSGFHIQTPLSDDKMASLQSDAAGKLLVHAKMELSPERVYTTSELILVK